MNPRKIIKWSRLSLVLSVLALFAAWISQLTGGSFLGLSQTHLFNDAIVLALLGIGGLLDSQMHTQRL